MNPTINNLRTLNPAVPIDRVQIEQELLELQIPPEVISWFFLKFQDIYVEYQEHVKQPNHQYDYEQIDFSRTANNRSGSFCY